MNSFSTAMLPATSVQRKNSPTVPSGLYRIFIIPTSLF
jgi:hypothetical protein